MSCDCHVTIMLLLVIIICSFGPIPFLCSFLSGHNQQVRRECHFSLLQL